MTRKSDKLSKWDEAWLNDSNQDKWDYVLEYIRVRWPIEVTQTIPPLWTEKGDKQKIVRDLFYRLLQESQIDTRGIIRRTKEAWRRYHNESLKRNSGNYTSIKLTKSDKNKMRKLAAEVGLSTAAEVVSLILSGEFKTLLTMKKEEKESKNKNKLLNQKKTDLVGFFGNSQLNKANKVNKQLRSELEDAAQNLAVLSEIVSEQIVILERYSDDGFEELSEEESKKVQELTNDMILSLKNNKFKRV